MYIGIGISRTSDPYHAGKGMAEEALGELDHPTPKCALLYATQYIREQGGYKQLLDGVHAVLPKDTPLVGGTVVGFMTNKVTSTRGAILYLVYDDDIEVAISCATNTKRWPGRAGKKAARQLQKKPTQDDKQDLILTSISGTKTPQMPHSRVDIVRNRFLASIMRSSFGLLSKLFQLGFGHEEAVLEEFVKKYPNCTLINSSSTEHSLVNNYQFFYDKVYTNAIVCLRISHNKDVYSDFSAGIDSFSDPLQVTNISSNKTFIHTLNGKPALKQILEVQGWKEELVPSLLSSDKYTFYPLAYIDEDGKLIVSLWPMIYGNSIALTNRVKDQVYLCLCTGKSLISATDTVLPSGFKPQMAFFSSCAIRLFGMGRELKEVKKKLRDYFGETPYLTVYGSGEAVYTPEKGLKYLNNTIVSCLLGRR